ncbi:hypothetical protein CABS01_08736 [Colletotrichum abscissum]|uniref:Uncharacterized protein n=1 Tax=Colletotrichum abscissum TaxID=1671311 RepID=A0A9P9XGT1_9PEZI|nr:uncharacterized protein CABS01_08736 [Colletotrichum abscissum]KAI3553598.1 hypothetical protein CABS02_06198 [Colletotrichum abscissum]KAK1504958.1 hypothetical protein CABS01_08736 [Colletotrichum abscissum]
MANVKIIVKNESDKVQQFLIFNEKPTYSESVGKAWTNVWGRSPGTGAKHGTTHFSIEEHYYAVCGMTPESLRTDLIMRTSDWDEVKLGTKTGKGTLEWLDIQEGGAVFDKNKIGELEKDGSFGIDTAAYDLTKYEHAFCGLGMKSPTPDQGEVLPVSVWRAEPNQKYQITPKRIYYISTGKFVPGRVVDFAQLGKTATIDFTGRKQNVATVIYNNELDFLPVKYSFDDNMADENHYCGSRQK